MRCARLPPDPRRHQADLASRFESRVGVSRLVIGNVLNCCNRVVAFTHRKF